MGPSDDIPKFFEHLRQAYADMDGGSGSSLEDDLKKYLELGAKYVPMVASWGAALWTLLSKCNLAAINAILEGIAGIGTWAACLTAVVLIKRAIDKEVSDAIKGVKLMLNGVLEYVSKRYVAIEKRIAEIDPMVLEIKLLATSDVDAVNRLVIALMEKIRLCNLDIQESVEKILAMNATITASAKEMEDKGNASIVTSFVFGAAGLLGCGVAAVTTGGLALVALAAAGAGCAAQAGTAYYGIKCKESQKIFIRMKTQLNQLIGDFERFKKRLEAHVEELKNANVPMKQ